MKKLHTLLIILVLILLGGCAAREMTRGNKARGFQSTTPPSHQEAELSAYVINKGDQIQISVWGYPEFNTTTPVKETGTLTIPFLGEVAGAGLTKEQITEDIRVKLSEYIRDEVKLAVSIVSSMTQKVTVLGAVIRQQNYPVMVDISLLDILSAAGGTTAESDLRHIKIIRSGANTHPVEVDLAWYMENGNIERIPMVRPGDTVFVPRKENLVREFSNFMRDLILLFGFFRVLN